MTSSIKYGLMCAVAVPVYKPFQTLSIDEMHSLRQLLKILGKHHIFFLGTSSIIDAYLKFTLDDIPAHTRFSKTFHEKYFRDIAGYNNFLLSKHFYNSFQAYNYVLIYQLDAYVFKDQLNFWCKKGFDYIGAPWFEDFHDITAQTIIGVGNGGFSLRNIKTSVSVLKRIRIMRGLHKLSLSKDGEGNWLFKNFIFIFSGLLKIKNRTVVESLIKPGPKNEDYFWCTIVAEAFNDYKLAPVSEALKFSFENRPSLLFEMNHKQLPFGCHAWQRYDLDFWSKYIPE